MISDDFVTLRFEALRPIAQPARVASKDSSCLIAALAHEQRCEHAHAALLRSAERKSSVVLPQCSTAERIQLQGSCVNQ